MYYGDGLTKATSFLAAYLSVIVAVLLGLAPPNVLWYAQAMNIPVVLVSKVSIFPYYFVSVFPNTKKFFRNDYYKTIFSSSLYKLMQTIQMAVQDSCQLQQASCYSLDL